MSIILVLCAFLQLWGHALAATNSTSPFSGTWNVVEYAPSNSSDAVDCTKLDNVTLTFGNRTWTRRVNATSTGAPPYTLDAFHSDGNYRFIETLNTSQSPPISLVKFQVVANIDRPAASTEKIVCAHYTLSENHFSFQINATDYTMCPIHAEPFNSRCNRFMYWEGDRAHPAGNRTGGGHETNHTDDGGNDPSFSASGHCLVNRLAPLSLMVFAGSVVAWL
ncbi:hypothetical protein SeMB42_g03692 [Synchytrium endobioticum]|uniref:Uncharacterized protein n=1 Tax=Synchytrium endobioticum TaxID=286115 RepID=A0A507D4T7_9FUNG|nr:hypothetical protein SeMB42_g03692 [Synchytrium endobioticum]